MCLSPAALPRAARQPVPEEAIPQFEKLVLEALQNGAPLAEALLSGYQAFLSTVCLSPAALPTNADNGERGFHGWNFHFS